MITPYGGAITRTQGCWNCSKWENAEKSRALWSQQRQATLAQALTLSFTEPEGEEHPKVVQIRRMVNTVDHGIASGHLGICLAGKANADFVDNAYLCDHWTGRTGASLAREGQKADKLPEELREEADAAAAPAALVKKGEPS